MTTTTRTPPPAPPRHVAHIGRPEAPPKSHYLGVYLRKYRTLG